MGCNSQVYKGFNLTVHTSSQLVGKARVGNGMAHGGDHWGVNVECTHEILGLLSVCVTHSVELLNKPHLRVVLSQ